MASNKKIHVRFHERLFLYLLLFFAAFLVCFIGFQYKREKEYKIDRLNYQLQLFNIGLADAISRGDSIDRYVAANKKEEDLRVTIIDTLGNVTYDSHHDRPLSSFTNHSDRPEFKKALQNGRSYTLRRLSESTDNYYFYSASLIDGQVIRSAVPYNMSLSEVLRADRRFLWFILAVTLVICAAAYLITKRLGDNIRRLQKFAVKADKGEPLDDIGQFPNDELGEISNHIVRLYTKLRETKDALENEHNVVLQQEQDQVRLKRQLTQNINHELKTPVAGIQGCLETIIDNPDMTPEKRNDFIKKSYSLVLRLSRLLKDVSTITRMDEASEMIEKETLSLSDLVRDVLDEMSIQTEGKGIRVAADIQSGIVINGNQTLLSSVFRNLVDNSLAYSGCSTIFLTVKQEKEGIVDITYSDDGIGIAEEHLPRIFERFYRVDKGRSRKMGGTGLGLSIVKNSVILHGGSIVARKREGGGLEFLFTLKN